MPIDLVTLQTRLTSAQAAYDRLLTGSMRERIDHNGTAITYTRVNADQLKEYIADLQSQIDAQAGAGAPRRRRMILTVYRG